MTASSHTLIVSKSTSFHPIKRLPQFLYNKNQCINVTLLYVDGEVSIKCAHFLVGRIRFYFLLL